MPTRIEIIKQEITTDPLGQGYSMMTDDQILAALTAKTRPHKVPVAVRDIVRYMVLNDLWLPIKQAAATDPNAAVAVDALSFFEIFDVTDPAVEAKLTIILDGLISSGLITPQQKTDILAMGDDTISRAEEIGTPDPTLGEVAQARRI